MNRRDCLALGVCFAATAIPVRAQSQRVFRLGVLVDRAPSPKFPTASRGWAVLLNELRRLGWTEGQNLTVELRASDGRAEQLPVLAGALVAARVDVILAGGSQATAAARKATNVIPIVMFGVSHPVEAGFVTSLARPGGNITGLTNQWNDLQAKHLELLLAVRPDLRKLGVLWSPSNSGSALAYQQMQSAAGAKGLTLQSLPVDTTANLDDALARAQSEHIQGLHVHPTGAIGSAYPQVIDWAKKNRVVTISGHAGLARAGLLLSYGDDPSDSWRQAAGYINQILRGGRPADLPVQQPTKFELIVNRRTAEAIGLQIPKDLLARADEVIE